MRPQYPPPQYQFPTQYPPPPQNPSNNIGPSPPPPTNQSPYQYNQQKTMPPQYSQPGYSQNSQLPPQYNIQQSAIPPPFPPLSLQVPDQTKGLNSYPIDNSFDNRSPVNSLRKTSSRIDPTQIPRPDKPQVNLVYQTRSGSGRRNPPCVNSIYTGQDTGNCLPRHIRSSLVAPPSTKDLHNQTGIPFVLYITPFAKEEFGEEPITKLDFGDVPPRCSRCKGYINPFVTFKDNGHKWTCNLCETSNPVPQWYFCPVDSVGLRTDRLHRPELNKGSVEIIVGEEYCSREIQTPVIVFAIDLSDNAIRKGITLASIRTIQKAMDELKLKAQSTLNHEKLVDTSLSETQKKYKQPSPLDYKVGIVGFSDTIMYFNINLQWLEPFRLIICDPDDPFPPLPSSSWLFSIVNQSNYLDLLLKKIVNLISDGSSTSRSSESCPLSAIKSITQSIDKLGGRVYVFTSSYSTKGLASLPKSIFNNEEMILHGTDEEVFLYGQPKEETFKSDPSANVSSSTIGSSPSRKKLNRTLPSNYSIRQNPKKKEELENYLQNITQFAKECCESRISINIYFFTHNLYHSPANPNLINPFPHSELFGDICYSTGGRFQLFTGPMTEEDNILLVEQQLAFDLDNLTALDTISKLRCSSSYSLESYIGPGQFFPLEEELILPTVDRNLSGMFLLKPTKSIKDEEKVYCQLAILYTDIYKRRIVRIHNLALFSSDKPTVIFRNSDIEVTVAAIGKIALRKALTFSLNDEKNGPRVYLNNLLVNLLVNYRKLCSQQGSKGLLILPESLKILPIYILGLLKHPALIENQRFEYNSTNSGASPSVASEVSKYPNKPMTPSSSTSSLTSLNSINNRSALASRRILPPSSLLVHASERAYEIRKLLSQPMIEIINSIHPRLYNLFSWLEEEDLEDDEEDKYDNHKPSDLLKPQNYDYSHSFVKAPGQPSDRNPNLSTNSSSSFGFNLGYAPSLGISRSRSGSGTIIGGSLEPCKSNKISFKHRLRLINKCLYPSAELLESDMIYLLDDRSYIWIFIGRNVSRQLIDQLFVVSSIPDNEETVTLRYDTSLGQRTRSFIDLLTQDSPYKQELRIVSNDMNTLLNKFSSRLIEDACAGIMSYVDYLCSVHNKVQGKLN